ncbi:hypothetical protein ACQEVY_01190 [Streptomyces sp. CA-288835]|uniref:hypothetical protein n=1 Tax=Streptomyces sp. CA-288835 TaxID=3240069 RepID=UPI003D927468
MGGFEVLVEAAAENAKAAEEALDAALDAPTREGIPLQMWRALPDSPGEES